MLRLGLGLSNIAHQVVFSCRLFPSEGAVLNIVPLPRSRECLCWNRDSGAMLACPGLNPTFISFECGLELGLQGADIRNIGLPRLVPPERESVVPAHHRSV